MAITVEGVTTFSQPTFISSEDFSHETSTSSNRLLVLLLGFGDAASISSVTYDGNAITRLGGAANDVDKMDIWYLVNPPTGSATISMQAADTAVWSVAALDIAGAHQSTPFGTEATNTGSSTNPSVTVSAATGDLVVDGVAAGDPNNAYTATAGAGQTERLNQDSGTNGDWDIKALGSTEAGAASVVMDWSLSSSRPWASIGVAVKPASGGTAASAAGGVNRGLINGGLINNGLIRRSMTKLGNLWVPDRRLIVPVGLQLQRS